jgi:hypothetical protein
MSWVELTPESAVAWAAGFLHAAARDGRVEKVMALLEETPAAVGTTDSSGKTALHWACAGGHVSTAELLISRAASITARDGDDKTPLGLCEGNADMVSALLPRVSFTDVNKSLLSNSRTLLHWASACGNVEAIECLVSRGASLSVKDEYGRTPLHAAVSGGPMCVRAAVALIKRGADLLASDHFGTTPLHALLAFDHRCGRLLRSIWSSDHRMSAVVSAARETLSVAIERAAEEAMVYKTAAEAGKAAAERAASEAAEAMAGKAAAEAEKAAAERAAAEAMAGKAAAEAGKAAAERAAAEAMAGKAAAERAAAEATVTAARAIADKEIAEAGRAAAEARAARDLVWIGAAHAACKAVMAPPVAEIALRRTLDRPNDRIGRARW